MKSKFKLFTIFISLSVLLLTGCAEKMAIKKFKHNTPLIKQDVKSLGKKEVEKSVEMGPTPVDGDVVKPSEETSEGGEPQVDSDDRTPF